MTFIKRAFAAVAALVLIPCVAVALDVAPASATTPVIRQSTSTFAARGTDYVQELLDSPVQANADVAVLIAFQDPSFCTVTVRDTVSGASFWKPTTNSYHAWGASSAYASQTFYSSFANSQYVIAEADFSCAVSGWVEMTTVEVTGAFNGVGAANACTSCPAVSGQSGSAGYSPSYNGIASSVSNTNQLILTQTASLAGTPNAPSAPSGTSTVATRTHSLVTAWLVSASPWTWTQTFPSSNYWVFDEIGLKGA